MTSYASALLEQNHDVATRLRDLINQLAVEHGSFILSSGQQANFYVDMRPLTLHHEGSPLVGQLVLGMLDAAGIEFEAIGGLTMGADPVATAVLHTAAADDRAVDGYVVRKQPKGHGKGRQVEGPGIEGRKVVVVEDTSTTGGSAMQAVRAVREVGGDIQAVAVIVDRDTGAKEHIEAESGVPYLYAYSKTDLGLA
ncbi:orotate phosphoribosyltransferase [Nesterenkonia ebinurensis]|uniref:orotate phosphoribosyltransferase n=1 Tax=Nesterenkonia ebinurensis TaxID=2608252 RepID=UPI00123D5B56|nr:orotate phosphoribosyltransferase [Nesterenkonia ebinurensis]